jgi:hypothetical protein
MDTGRRDSSTTVMTVVAALLVGLGLGAVAILVWAGPVAEDRPVAAERSSATEAQSASAVPTASSGDPEPSRLDRCAAASAALRGPLGTAGPALEQWAVHIGAMNQLVAGEITLQQASDFWNRTRLGAQRRVDRFAAAWAAARHRGIECPAPVVAPPNPELRPCVEQVAAEIRRLEAARTSLRTWDEHIHHMDMLRLGELSPADATAMWISMWKRGDRDLQAYRTAASQERAQDGCPEPGVPE